MCQETSLNEVISVRQQIFQENHILTLIYNWSTFPFIMAGSFTQRKTQELSFHEKSLISQQQQYVKGTSINSHCTLNLRKNGPFKFLECLNSTYIHYYVSRWNVEKYSVMQYRTVLECKFLVCEGMMWLNASYMCKHFLNIKTLL